VCCYLKLTLDDPAISSGVITFLCFQLWPPGGLVAPWWPSQKKSDWAEIWSVSLSDLGVSTKCQVIIPSGYKMCLVHRRQQRWTIRDYNSSPRWANEVLLFINLLHLNPNKQHLITVSENHSLYVRFSLSFALDSKSNISFWMASPEGWHGLVAKVLASWSEGCGFDSRHCHVCSQPWASCFTSFALVLRMRRKTEVPCTWWLCQWQAKYPIQVRNMSSLWWIPPPWSKMESLGQ
jgi:hypothetical protein